MNFSKKVILTAMLFLELLCSSVFCQMSSNSINFTKKEIVVLKWGNGDKEISKSSPLKGLKIDGMDNIYFTDGSHQRTFIISSDGNSIKSVDFKTTGGFNTVDEVGDIFGLYYKKGEPLGLKVTKPDGTTDTYKDFNLGHVDNGVAYDQRGNKAITIRDNGDKPEKLSPHLMSFTSRQEDKGNILGWNDVLEINTQKINRHLGKINRHLDMDKITIKIEQKKDAKHTLIYGEGWVLSVDDIGNVYVLCTYKNGNGPRSKVVEGYVDVYSPNGMRLTRISDSSSIGNWQADPSLYAIDIQGNIFQLLSSDDGVHIIKQIKS
jgi:hypothetical protein